MPTDQTPPPNDPNTPVDPATTPPSDPNPPLDPAPPPADSAAKGTGTAGPDSANAPLDLTPWWVYLAIAAVMGVILWGSSAVAKWRFRSVAEQVTRAYQIGPIKDADGKTIASHRDLTTCTAVTDADKGAFILRQRTKIGELADGHRDAAIEFGSYFFANTVILGIFGFISLISLLLITKRGIASAPGTLIAVFLLSSGVGLIYQGFLGVFQQKGNVEGNHKQSVDYGRIVDEVDAYCSTGKLAVSSPTKAFETMMAEEAQAANTDGTTSGGGTAKGKYFVAVDPDAFILHVEWRIEELKGFSMALDEKPISTFTTDPNRVF